MKYKSEMKAYFLIITSVFLLVTGCGNSSKMVADSAVASDNTVVNNVVNFSVDTRTVNDTITEIPYDIPSQRFDETMQALFHATGLFCNTDLSKTGSVKVNAVKGRMSVLEAVETAIKDTGLKIKEYNDTVITVE